jgi:hypothetical protein
VPQKNLPKYTPRCTSRGQYQEHPVEVRKGVIDVTVLIVDLVIMVEPGEALRGLCDVDPDMLDSLRAT